jgi:hypothetical protein
MVIREQRETSKESTKRTASKEPRTTSKESTTENNEEQE